MGKKRRRGVDSGPTGPREVDPEDAKLGRITTFEDIADEQEEYFMNQDKILFEDEDEPKSKRSRRDAETEAFLDHSDEEILDYSEDESEEDQSKPSKGRQAGHKAAQSDESESEGGDAEGDDTWWGSKRQEYYDGDDVEDEEDALQEEAEAKRLQQKKLAKLTEDDFVFDPSDWAAKGDEEAEEDDQDVVTETLKMEITEDMDPDERYRIFSTQYPEFDPLADELVELYPLLSKLKAAAEGLPMKSIESVKYHVLACYVATLGMYFAILTSPVRDVPGSRKTLEPAELQDHEVMERLVECKKAWQDVKDLTAAPSTTSEQADTPQDEVITVMPREKPSKKAKAQSKSQTDLKAAEKLARKKVLVAEVEKAMGDLPKSLPTLTKKSKKAQVNGVLAKSGSTATAKQSNGPDWEVNSDFGEEETLDERTAAQKAARKKSLSFYTSEIAQKANRRAEAARVTGGDTDIPYRERLKDRQARLNKEAERRGQRDSKAGAALDEAGDDSGDGDDGKDAAIPPTRGDDADDEYYDMLAASKQKKEQKAARKAALAEAGVGERVVEVEELGEDGRRKVTYAIEKNTGLAPRRKKENRNPRVKKKMQYEAKKKKLRSQMATYKGGEPTGGYGGEMSGINISLVRSRKLG